MGEAGVAFHAGVAEGGVFATAEGEDGLVHLLGVEHTTDSGNMLLLCCLKGAFFDFISRSQIDLNMAPYLQKFFIKSIQSVIVALIPVLVFSSCESLGSSKYLKNAKEVYTPKTKSSLIKVRSNMSFNDRPDQMKQMLLMGEIDNATYENWLGVWAKEKQIRDKKAADNKKWQDEEKRKWDSLTPQQQYDIELQNRKIQLMEQQASAERSAAIARGYNALNQSLQNQEMINAYDRRTRVMSQPVDVNVNGNINHTFNPVYQQPYFAPRY